MTTAMTRALPVLCLLMLSACPPINSTPCAEDAECRADQRCRRGACGPICLDDTECGDNQVCLVNGTCGARPECSKDTECASGFACVAGRCACEDDSACAANQRCTAGTCQTRPRCTADADCIGTGARCEVTQGLCLPICQMPQDCAPTLDPRVAFALYTCDMGTCTRRCTQDLQCGGAGLICRLGKCAAADCKDTSECPNGKYCTSATFGRCETFTTCTDSSQCLRNYQCGKFSETSCPPGFDCSQSLCLELQRCLADTDCVSGIPGTMTSERTGYCEEGHCQPSPTCVVDAQCTGGKICVGEVCVPNVCRAHVDCGAGKACVDGVCATAPAATDINILRMSPTTGFLVEGDTMTLHVLALRLDGTTYPLTDSEFEVQDLAGMPSNIATVTNAGVLTAVTAGDFKVRAGIAGTLVKSNFATVRVVPAVMMGRRVVVTDAATGAPLSGVHVRACQGDCSTVTDVISSSDGLAEFPLLDAQAATFTAVPVGLRSDGLPSHERATVMETTVTDLALPLRENPVKSAAGFSASVSFNYVSTVGSYWAGFVAASVTDVPSLTPQRLLGDNFMVEVPGLNQRAPVPGALVLYTSPGLGIPQEVKARSLSFAQPGTDRFVQSWAGRAQLDSALNLRSVDLLSYLGAFDYAQEPRVSFTSRPYVPDSTDVDDDGLCSVMSRCPMGSEEVPDYANFTQLSFQPQRQQKLRTEVIVPKVPGTFDTVLIASTLFNTRAGMLTTGFASKTAEPAGQDGLREVGSVIVRGGPAYNGLEIAEAGLWALAASANGNSQSARLVKAARLDSKVLLRPFLPAPADATWAPGTRTFNPGQPAWSSVYSTGGELGRVSLVGTDTRHVLYFPMRNAQAAIVWPSVPPGGPGQDPTTQAATTLELVAVDLVSGVSLEQLFDTRGVTLASWAQVIDGYSRLDR